MLARLAASTDNQSADSEAAIEKYLRSVLAVENILTLDRLRQVGHWFASSPFRLCVPTSQHVEPPCVTDFAQNMLKVQFVKLVV